MTDIRPPIDTDALTAAAYFGDDDPAIGYNRVFFALQRIQRTMMPAIERQLRELGIADPIWYEIIEAAEKAGPEGVQMLALEKRLFVQQYALSRHVSRMVKAGLVRSVATGGAGRGRAGRLGYGPSAAGGGMRHQCPLLRAQPARRASPASRFGAAGSIPARRPRPCSCS